MAPSGGQARLHVWGRVQLAVARVPVAPRHGSEPLSDARRTCACGRSSAVPAVVGAQVGPPGREPHGAPSGAGSAPGRDPTFESRVARLLRRERAILALFHTTSDGRDMPRYVIRKYDEMGRGRITAGKDEDA